MNRVQKNNPLVSIIIINFNGKHDLVECLDSVSKLSYSPYEILIVDNASTDGSVNFIKKHYPNINLIQSKINLGYAKAHDLALEKAKGDAYLFLNADTVIQKNLLTALVSFLYAKKDRGIVMPKIVLYQDPEKIDAVGSFLIPDGNLYHYGREQKSNLSKFSKPYKVFTVKNVATLMKREVVEKIGMFDPDYFAYFEETDVCMRAWLAGYTIWYCPDSTVQHKGGVGSLQFDRSHIIFHSEKNRIMTYLKNLSWSNTFRILFSLWLKYQVAIVLYCLSGKLKTALEIEKAIAWNIKSLSATLKKRAHVQRVIRKIRDEDYLPEVTRHVKLSYYYYQFFGGIERYTDES